MIDLQPSSEQEQIIDSVAGLLRDRLPLDRLRAHVGEPSAAAEANRDRDAWPGLGELGVFGLGLAEEYGGFGYGLAEEVLVARELGRFLVSPSAIATMVAAHVAAAAGRADLAQAIQAGQVAVAATVARLPAATAEPGEYLLLDGAEADWTLVWTEATLALLAREAWDQRRAIPAIDPSVPLERARLVGLEGAVGGGGKLARHARLLACAYLVGIAEAAVEDSVEYAKVRQQFGQPIGAFQAIKHRCADMLARASAAWNLTLFAALSEASGAADAGFQSLAAKIIAADAASRNAAVNIQNHGGIGFTRELHAHLFVKRAHTFDLLGGSSGLLKKRLLAAEAPLQAV